MLATNMMYTTPLVLALMVFVLTADGSYYSNGRQLTNGVCGTGKRWYTCKPCQRDCGLISQCGLPRQNGGYGLLGRNSFRYAGNDLASICPCKPGCACTPGRYWDRRLGKCVKRCPKDYCPGNQVCRCVKCVRKCPSRPTYSYGYQPSRCYAYRCRKQCTCPKGKYFNKNGRCVRPGKCSSVSRLIKKWG